MDPLVSGAESVYRHMLSNKFLFLAIADHYYSKEQEYNKEFTTG